MTCARPTGLNLGNLECDLAIISLVYTVNLYLLAVDKCIF